MYSSLGDLYHGARGAGNRRKEFTVRVYPFGDDELRTQERCVEIVDGLYDQGTDVASNDGQTAIASRTKKATKNSFGHLGKQSTVIQLIDR
jgi:hypothetical protein